jgi:hypothetical protein
MAFLLVILVLMSITGMEIQVVLIPIWLAFLFLMYKIYKPNSYLIFFFEGAVSCSIKVRAKFIDWSNISKHMRANWVLS